MEEGGPLPLDVLDLLFGHGPAHHIGLAQGVAAQLLEDLNDLLLVDDTAVGVGQDGLQSGVLVGDLFGVIFPGDEPGNGFHGTRTVQGNNGGDVLNAVGLQTHTYAGHTCRLHLEHAGGAPLGEHLKGLGVVLRDGLGVKPGLPPLDQLGRVVQHGQVAQTQKVHFQQTQLFQSGHDVLGDHQVVVFGQGDIIAHRAAGDDHAGGVGGGVAGHALDGLGGVDELAHLGAGVVGLLQLFGQLQGLLQGDVQGTRTAGYLLGQGVHLSVGHIQHPAHVPDGRSGGHGTEGDDLGHVVGAVLSGNVVDDLLTAADAEVDVDIRHGDALGVQEALEVQVILHGVQVGDVQAVGHHGASRRATARSHRDAVIFGVGDEVGDDEEVVHKAHLADHGHLIFQLLAVLLGLAGIAAQESLLAQVLKIGVAVLPALGQLEVGQVVLAELKFHVAGLGDLGGVLQGLGALGEQGGHLLLGLDVKLLSLKLHPPGIVHRLARLDAHKDVLHLRVLAGKVVGVVGAHQGDTRLPVQAQDALVHLALGGDAVVLELQVVAVLPKELPHFQGHLFGFVVLPRHEELGDLAAQAGGQGDEPAAVLPQQVQVDTGLDVKALQKGLRDHVGEVAVALLVAAQQHQVREGGVVLVDLLKAGAAPGRHIDLAADDRLHPRILAGPVEVDDAVHDPVVGDGNRLLADVLYPLHQLFDAAGPVQQGKLSMQV